MYISTVSDMLTGIDTGEWSEIDSLIIPFFSDKSKCEFVRMFSIIEAGIVVTLVGPRTY